MATNMQELSLERRDDCLRAKAVNCADCFARRAPRHSRCGENATAWGATVSHGKPLTPGVPWVCIMRAPTSSLAGQSRRDRNVSEVKLPDNVSLALARFADVLCMYDIEVFSAQLKGLLAGPASRLDERTIMFRLAEHAVHVSAVEMLEARDRKADADNLRSLAPIVDQATARAARLATDTIEGKPVGHARGAALFAACDANDEGAPARAAEHAAYAVAERASCYADPEAARKVYDEAVDLLAALRTGPPVA
jgi:hypothetical protein